MARLFVALELPTHVIEALASLRTGLDGARWVRPEQMHLTMRFLGDVPADAVHTVVSAMATVTASSFELAIHGVGVFPGGRRPPRVLWAGVRPHEPLGALKSAIDGALDPILGGDPETRSAGGDDSGDRPCGRASGRAFAPHLTVARFKEPPVRGELQAYLAAHAALGSASWVADHVVLFQSHLGAAGARHVPLVRVALAR